MKEHLKEHAWKKGCASPNPTGRPKTKLLTASLVEQLAQVDPKDKQKRTNVELVALAMITAAKQGDMRAASEIGDRIEGKPLQSVDMNVNGPSRDERIKSILTQRDLLKKDDSGKRVN